MANEKQASERLGMEIRTLRKNGPEAKEARKTKSQLKKTAQREQGGRR